MKYVKSPKYFHNRADNSLQFIRYFPFLRGGITQDKHKLPYRFKNSAIALHHLKSSHKPQLQKQSHVVSVFLLFLLSKASLWPFIFKEKKQERHYPDYIPEASAIQHLNSEAAPEVLLYRKIPDLPE